VAGRLSQGPPLGCAFYRTDVGHEPVREWLRELGKVVSKEIGSDILTVQWNWPVGKPLVDGLGDGLYEVRSTHRRKEYRVFFCISASTMVRVHGIVKKTRSTPRADLELARRRLRGGGTMSKKHVGSSLGSFLDEMNIREETELLAIKKTLSLQLRQAMKRKSVSQSRLAKEMHTSRTVINRMLDPGDTGVTLATLTRASHVLGLQVDIRLTARRTRAA